jgi:tRNA pseudouridine32 synthase/23S rRNA pseudouridine746 synthase
LPKPICQIQALKQERKILSRQLQAELHASYALTNFAGQSQALSQLFAKGLPTGTGECCAPKLLHYAASHQLQPLALAEFWWGPASARGDRQPGQFYGACLERCQPIMGFLLTGLEPDCESIPADLTLSIFAQGEQWLAVAKPAGLLSVSGRDRRQQDSVFSRLQLSHPDGANLLPVHRLDQDTSGILLFARNRGAHRHLTAQFRERKVHKLYEAILEGVLLANHGQIDLPLWGDPSDRPRQKVDWQRGKPSQTQFKVIDRTQTTTRLELIPLTGRTHQLRVHLSDSSGLGIPIVGDRLYGTGLNIPGDRLYLHAKTLEFRDPKQNILQRLILETPF